MPHFRLQLINFHIRNGFVELITGGVWPSPSRQLQFRVFPNRRHRSEAVCGCQSAGDVRAHMRRTQVAGRTCSTRCAFQVASASYQVTQVLVRPIAGFLREALHADHVLAEVAVLEQRAVDVAEGDAARVEVAVAEVARSWVVDDNLGRLDTAVVHLKMARHHL